MTSRIGALIIVDREKAKAEIFDAINQARGNKSLAAKVLAVPMRTFMHWVQKLDLYGEIDALCEAKGYKVHPGADRKQHRKTD